MSRKHRYYLLAVVLLATFLIKGAVAVAPLFNPHIKLSILQELVLQTDTENAKSGTEKTIEKEMNEYCQEHHFLHAISSPACLSHKNNVDIPVSVRQLFYRSVPTPPPDKCVL
jgi:hypothetical protein